MPRNPNPPPPGPGRPKGSKNKAPEQLRKAIFEALHADEGATAYMRRLKDERPELFTSLLRGFIPKDINVTAEVRQVVTVARSFVASTATAPAPPVLDVEATHVDPTPRATEDGPRDLH